ncbi:MAG: sigma-70 family RNA polymerase sigma factor [Clostridia bacterium]|nr:sigma-70 family RNA polymerase sigma factor [Clostridia bacterium]
MISQKPNLVDIPIADIMQKYSGMVYRLAYARTKNKADTEDLFQEVFLRCLKSNPQFNSDEHCKAWLIRVTVNCGKNLLTSMWRKKVVLTEKALEGFVGNDKDTLWDGKSEAFYAVMKLPEKYRIVIHLHYYEDYSVAEIGKILNRKESTVKTQLHRARELLKQELKGDYDYV